MEEHKVYESHPLMFKNHPIGFILCIILIVAYGVGLLILLVWWIDVFGTTLTLTNERITLRKGILFKYINEIYHTDVRNIQISQGPLQRIFGVGDIGISSAGQSGIEITVKGIPNPEKVKEIINQYRKQRN